MGMIYNNMSVMREQEMVGRPATTGRPAKAATKSKSNRRQPEPEPFDPNELSRRLYLVLADQRSAAEIRRRARAEAAARKAGEGTVTSSSERQRSGGTASQSKSATAPADSSNRKPKKDALRPKASNKQLSSDTPAEQPAELRRSRSRHAPSQPKPSRLDLRSAASKPAKDESQSPTHYVPKQAAEQFALTTTSVNMRQGGLIHKLSRNALRFHLQGDRSLSSDVDMTPTGQAKALRRAQSKKERLHERNQFQRTAILEEAAEIDEVRQQQEDPNRYTFAAELNHLRGLDNPQQNSMRRDSSGSFEHDEGHRRSILMELEDIDESEVFDPTAAQDHLRVDWSQSDEARQKAVVSPVLKKADSIWTLRGRLGSTTRRGREEKEGGVSGRDSVVSPEPPKTPKSPRSGFFSRFKR